MGESKSPSYTGPKSVREKRKRKKEKGGVRGCVVVRAIQCEVTGMKKQ